jgi:NADH:ubiquinone oxidoreductase subunit F (NADH-binding)/(2Fe-2S) ferredoxin
MPFHRTHVLICGGAPCVLEGCKPIKEAFIAALESKNLSNEIKVIETGCLGPCSHGPALIVYPEGTMYGPVGLGDIQEIVESHLLRGEIVRRLLVESGSNQVIDYERPAYLSPQQRIVLQNCGVINPDSIEEYIGRDGYSALGKTLTEMTPEAVIRVIADSGLRGRGGAAFPTGTKWQALAAVPADQKYVICNADEGEPGTFKDRLILEGDPHTVIEAMAIAGYAVGANKGYIYIRGEYQLSIQRLQKAIYDAKELGLLGENIFGSGFNFEIEFREGAGAYVCGDETALIESIEGKRGEPRLKPPFPFQAGLWGRPTLVNNVETLANIPRILLRGAEWFRSFGTENSPGTKVYTMTGNINNKGLIEVPMGITLREVIYGIGGGIPGGRKFKMAQTGGGGCLPQDFLDLAMDYGTLAGLGSTLGTGALLVIDDSHCVIDIAKCFARFYLHESCGRCTPCREGTLRLYQLLDKISNGAGGPADLDLIETLGRVMQRTALCGLGQTAPMPLLTSLKYFRDEVEAHFHGQCPAGVCRISAPKQNVS